MPTLDELAKQQRKDNDARRRRQIITEARDEWRRIGPELLRQNPGLKFRHFVNGQLSADSLAPITPEELRDIGD